MFKLVVLLKAREVKLVFLLLKFLLIPFSLPGLLNWFESQFPCVLDSQEEINPLR
jgi:hypothetical protein